MLDHTWEAGYDINTEYIIYLLLIAYSELNKDYTNSMSVMHA